MKSEDKKQLSGHPLAEGNINLPFGQTFPFRTKISKDPVIPVSFSRLMKKSPDVKI